MQRASGFFTLVQRAGTEADSECAAQRAALSACAARHARIPRTVSAEKLRILQKLQVRVGAPFPRLSVRFARQGQCGWVRRACGYALGDAACLHGDSLMHFHPCGLLANACALI